MALRQLLVCYSYINHQTVPDDFAVYPEGVSQAFQSASHVRFHEWNAEQYCGLCEIVPEVALRNHRGLSFKQAFLIRVLDLLAMCPVSCFCQKRGY